MAAIRPVRCERCGRRREDVCCDVPMRAGVWGCVCRPCKANIVRMFGNGFRARRGVLVDVLPALSERTPGGEKRHKGPEPQPSAET